MLQSNFCPLTWPQAKILLPPIRYPQPKFTSRPILGKCTVPYLRAILVLFISFKQWSLPIPILDYRLYVKRLWNLWVSANISLPVETNIFLSNLHIFYFFQIICRRRNFRGGHDTNGQWYLVSVKFVDRTSRTESWPDSSRKQQNKWNNSQSIPKPLSLFLQSYSNIPKMLSENPNKQTISI